MVERHCSGDLPDIDCRAGHPGARRLVLNQVIVNFGSSDAVHRKALTESVVARVPRGGVCYAAGRNGAMIG